MSRKDQDVIWADKMFKERLKDIKAKRQLNGNPVNNIGELTREMLDLKSFELLEKELLKTKRIKKSYLRMRIDKKLL